MHLWIWKWWQNSQEFQAFRWRCLTHVSTPVLAGSSRPGTSYGMSDTQSTTGFGRVQNIMRPHTVGEIPRTSSRRLGTGSTMALRRPGTQSSFSLRPSTGGSNLLSPEEFMQLQQQCIAMQERLDRLETAIEEGDFSRKDKKKAGDDEGGILPTHLGIRFNQVRFLNSLFILKSLYHFFYRRKILSHRYYWHIFCYTKLSHP